MKSKKIWRGYTPKLPNFSYSYATYVNLCIYFEQHLLIEQTESDLRTCTVISIWCSVCYIQWNLKKSKLMASIEVQQSCRINSIMYVCDRLQSWLHEHARSAMLILHLMRYPFSAYDNASWMLLYQCGYRLFINLMNE